MFKKLKGIKLRELVENQAVQNFINRICIVFGKFAGLIIFLFYDFSGIRWVLEKIHPPKKDEKLRGPSTFLVWIIGLYVAVFGLSTGLYNQEREAIISRIDLLVSSVNEVNHSYVFSNLAAIQSSSLPVQPEFISFQSKDMLLNEILSPFESLVRQEMDDEIIGRIKSIFELQKDQLFGTEYSTLSLSNSRLEGSNWSQSVLNYVDFEGGNFSEANFRNSIIRNSDFSGAVLSNADFSNSIIEGSLMSGLELVETTVFNNVIFRNTLFEYIFKEPEGPSVGSDMDLSNAQFESSTILINQITGYQYSCGFEDCMPAPLPLKAPIINSNFRIGEEFNELVDFGRLCISRQQFETLRQQLSGKTGFDDFYLNEMVYRPACDTVIIFFEEDRSVVSGVEQEKVDLVYDVMASTNCEIRIEGHTPRFGAREYNLALGERMAQGIGNYLAVKGISQQRISTISYGEERPYPANYLPLDLVDSMSRRAIVNFICL